MSPLTTLSVSKASNPYFMKCLYTSSSARSILLFLLLLITTSSVLGQTNTWDGSSSNNWNTAANWSLNQVPTSAHNVVIPDGFDVTINTAAVCNTFTIDGGGSDNTVTISGTNSLTVTGAVTINAGTGTNDDKFIVVDAGSLTCGTLSLALSGADDRNVEVTISTGTVTVSGNIVMNGTAARNAIRFSNTGLLRVGSSISGGTIVASTGTVEYYGNGTGGTSSNQTIATYTYNNLRTSGTGTKTLAANTTANGILTVSAGTTLSLSTFTLSTPTSLVLECGAATGSSITGSGTLTLGGNVTVNDAAGAGTSGATISAPLALGATRTFTVANDGSTAVDLLISSVVSGSAGLTKDGAGTMDLSAANTYTGTTTVTAGILRASNTVVTSTNGAFGNNNNNISLNGGTIQSNTATFSKPISVAATNSALDAYGSARIISSTINKSAAGTFTLNIGGTTAASAEGQELTLSGAISNTTTTLNLNKVGTSTVILSGSNSFSGTTTITAGILRANSDVISGNNGAFGNTSSSSATILNGGTLQINTATFSRGIAVNATNSTIDAYGSARTVSANINQNVGGTFNLNVGGTTAASAEGQILTISGNITNASGTLSLTKIGSSTVILSGTSNTYSGSTGINSGGILRISAANRIPDGSAVTADGTLDMNGASETVGSIAGSGSITSAAAGTITLTAGGDNSSTSFSGIISNGSATVSLTKTGNGTLTLSGANTYTGTTTITGGEIVLGAAERIANTSNLVLNGGILRSGATAGFSETVGTLNLSANSTINLGTGNHNLNFAASNLVGWTAGRTLTINGWTGLYNGTTGTAGKIFVGNNASGLTAAQLLQIQFNDGVRNIAATILSTGEVVPSQAAPTSLSYTSPNTFINGAAISALNPTVGGGTPNSYSVSPALPAGLTLNTSTGVITGTPTASAATNTYTVTASNYGGSVNFGIVITVVTNRYAVANGNWNATSTWSATSGGSSGASIPVAGDNVFIGEGATDRTVTIPSGYNAACASVTMGNQGDNTNATLNFNANTSTLTVSGDVVMNRPNAGANITIGLGAGTLTVNGNLTLSEHSASATNNNRISLITISTGTLNANGNLIFDAEDAAQSQIVFSGAGTLNITGSFTATNNLGTLTPSTGTVNYNGGSQTVIDVSSVSYNNLTLSGSGTKTAGAAVTANSLLTVGSGITFNLANTNLTVGSLTGAGNITHTTGTSGSRTIAIGSDNASPAAYSGVISNGTASSVSLTKTGNGTLTLSGANTYTGTTTITAGTIQLGASGVIADGSNLVLNGGGLRTGVTAGFSETVGTLNLSANSTINLGTGSHNLNFAASNLVGWTGSRTLTINGWTGLYNGTTGTAGKLFVGSNSSGLTAGQLLQIQFNDGTNNIPAIILSTGEVVPSTVPPSGLSYTSPNTFGSGAVITPLNPTVTGVVSSYSVSPALPAGLTLNTSSGVISGTPTTATATATYTVTATNAGGSTTFGVVITVSNFRYAVNNNNWNNTITWSATSGGSSGASVPVAGDIVFIGEGGTNRTVTIPAGYSAACSSLTMGTQSDNTVATLVFSASTSTLTVSGDVTMNRPDAGATSTITLGAGTLTVNGNLTLSEHGGSATNNNRINLITISTGTLNANGNLIFDAEEVNQSQIVFSGAGTLNITGSFTATNNLGTLTPSTGTVNFRGGNQTVTDVSSISYNNLTLSGSGTKTLVAATTSIGGDLTLSGTAVATTVANLSIGGDLDVGTGTSFATGANFTLSVTGTTSVTGGLTLAGTGSKNFTGDVTINAGGIWNETGVAAYSFGNNFTNNATTFSANTGVHTFSGTTRTIGGTTTNIIPSVAVTGSYTNNSILTVATALSGAGTLANAGTLNTGGTVSVTTLSNSATMTHTGGAISTAVANFTNTGTLNLQGSGTIAGVTNNAGGTVNLVSSGTITSFNNATATSTLNISTTPTVPTITALTATTAGNTVNYTGTGNQTVVGVNYSNLGLSGSGTKTLQSGTTAIGSNFILGGTVTVTAVTGLNIDGAFTIGSGTTFNASTFSHSVAGNWTNNGTFTASTGTINFDGVTQSIGGSNSTTFNNLTLSNSGTKTFGIAQNAGGVLNIATGVVLNLGTFTSSANSLIMGGVDRASGSWGNTASSATWTNNTFFAATTGIVNVATCVGGLWTGAVDNDWFNTGNWCGGLPTASTNVVINSGGNQPNINAAGAFSNNLTVSSGASLTLGAAGTLSINGAFANSGTFTANANSTVNYSQASGTQTLQAANYGNLILSGSGTKTFPTGTVGIAGTFTPGGFPTATQGTIDFNGSGSQTIPAFNYFNLSSGNTGTRTIVSGTSIGVAGLFTPGSNGYTTTGSTIVFNGTGTQAIPVFAYHHLTKDGTGTAAFDGNTTINGDLTISAGTLRIDNNGNVINVGRNYIHSNGTFEVYNGNLGSTVTGTLNLAGDFTMSNGSINTNAAFINTATLNFNFNGSASQVFLKSGGTISTSNFFGTATNNFAINSGSIVDFGTSVLNGTGNFTNNGTIITANTGGLALTGNNGSVQLSGTRTYSTSGNYIYNGLAAQQTGNGVTGAVNVTINNTAGVTLNSNIVISGTLTLTSGAFNVSGRTLQFQTADIPVVRDGSTSTGTITTNNSTTLQFGSAGNTGGVSFTLPSNVFTNTPAVLGSFSINRTNPVTLGSQDISVSNTLTLTAGILSSGSNTVIVAAGGTVARTNGHVNGNLRKFVPAVANPSVVYEIGDASFYTPLTLAITGTVTNNTGSITARATSGDHPNIGTSGINENKSVNRYWTVTNNTTVPGLSSYNATFAYNASDNDAGSIPANYQVRRYNGSTWIIENVTAAPTNVLATATGLTAFGEFAIGESTGTIVVSTQPSNTTICTGSNASFTAASNSLPAPTVKWQRDNGVSGFIDIDGTTDGGIYSDFTTGTLQLTGATTSQNGYLYRAVFSNINNPSGTASDPASLTVSAFITPAVTMSITTGANPSCAGSTLTFTANATLTGGGTVTYTFLKNGVPEQTGSSNLYTPASVSNGDVFRCSISIAGGLCLNTTTANSATTTITVNPLITPTATITSSVGNTICSGTNVTFTASATNTGGGTLSYQFLKNNVEVQNGLSATYLATGIADGDQYSCIVTITGGACLSSNTATSNTVTMTVVNPNITPTVTISASPGSTVCAGTSVTFTAIATGTAGGTVTYNFKIGNTVVQSGSSNTYTTSSLANGNIVSCEIGVGGGTCVTTTAASNNIAMTVAALPTVTLTRVPTGDICAGTSITFTAAATNPGGGTISYNFKINGSSIQSGSSNTFTHSSFANGDQVTCDISVAGGTCDGTTASSNSLVIPVVTTLTPVVSLSASPGATLCAGGSVTFTATASNTSGGTVNYNFRVNGVSVQNSTSSTFITNSLANGNTVNCIITVTGVSCGTPTATSNSIVMTIASSSFVWTGATSNAWNVASNWNSSCGLPPAGSNVIIPTGAPRYPVISSGTVSAGNITIQTGASIAVNGTGTLAVAGTITNTGTLSITGTIEFNGTSTQTVNGSVFAGSTVKNLKISNNVTLSGLLSVSGVVSFGNVNNRQLNSAGFLVLRSTVSGTASVADLTNSNTSSGNTITGNVTVERYIPAARKWRGLSAPLRGSSLNSIFDNWQNGGAIIQNTGVLLWSPTGTGPTGNGFSQNTLPGASQNLFGYSINTFTTPSNTKTAPLFTSSGPVPYLIFVTDQYRTGANTGSMGNLANPLATTLRATGNLITGDYSVGSLAAGYRMIANPYASPIDFATIGKTNINNQFWVWDPKYFGINGNGGYVYTANTGSGYISAPLGGSYDDNSTIIPSGSAFWVRVNDGFIGALSFKETDKAIGGYSLFGGRTNNGTNEVLRVNLRNISGDMYDGVASVYNNTSSTNVDASDVQKFSTGGESISIRRAAKDLAIEMRPLISLRDTVFLQLYNLKQQEYKLEISGKDFEASSNLVAVLQDLFLNTETPLNIYSSQDYRFTVTSAVASTGGRFRIVFRPSTVTPVTNLNGELKGIAMYPNPMVKGSAAQVSFTNVKAGRYELRMYDMVGVQVLQRVIVHNGGSAIQAFEVPQSLASGNYIAEIINEKGISEKIKVTIQ
jgi:autotransporter-associated beta strand protein